MDNTTGELRNNMFYILSFEYLINDDNKEQSIVTIIKSVLATYTNLKIVLILYFVFMS